MKAYPLCATVDVRVRDGRLVQVATVGDPRGRTVVLHHGTPGSRLFVENLRSLTEAGLFIICHSRPGYGRSTSHPGRRVADVVADVEDVLDVMGRDAYVSVGHSGGGPHALACAALDERCLAGWSISGLAPFQGFDWSEDMGEANVTEFTRAIAGGAAFEEHMKTLASEMAAGARVSVQHAYGDLLSEADRAVTESVSSDDAVRRFDDAFSQGHVGMMEDDLAHVNPWGFNLEEIAVPVHVWWGGEDRMVPSPHGEQLIGRIPGAIGLFSISDGHASLLTNEMALLSEEIQRETSAHLPR